MRVTKVISEYVYREVYAKFRDKIDAARAEYDGECRELQRRLDELRQETEAKAYEIAKSMGFDYHNWRGSNKSSVVIYADAFGNAEKAEAANKAESALQKQRQETVDNILLSLELGEATKDELRALIDAVDI